MSQKPCPRCRQVGNYGNVIVTNNQLVRGCNACNHHEAVDLPTLRKNVIYLDQCFLSQAFRAKSTSVTDAAKKIHALSDRQLILCPWSTIHQIETRLWRSTEQESLWQFIRSTARTKSFRSREQIELRQLHRSFAAFTKGQTPGPCLERYDALHQEVDHWDGYNSVSTDAFFRDIHLIRIGKDRSTIDLVALFPRWRAEPLSYSAAYAYEVSGHAGVLQETAAQYYALMSQGDLSATLWLSCDAHKIPELANAHLHGLSASARSERVTAFLSSAHFSQTAHVDIMSRVYAHLRQLVQQGAFASHTRAWRTLKSVHLDVGFVSVFAPYCDAVFVDNQMAAWLTSPNVDLPSFGCRVFCANRMDEFLEYLDAIAAQEPPEHATILDDVYGN